MEDLFDPRVKFNSLNIDPLFLLCIHLSVNYLEISSSPIPPFQTSLQETEKLEDFRIYAFLELVSPGIAMVPTGCY